MLTTPPSRLIALALSLGVIAVLLLSPGSTAVSPAQAQEPDAANYIIVQYRSERVSANSLDLTAGAPSLEDEGFRKVPVPEGKTAAEAIAELAGDPDVISAEEDVPVYAAATPNDPLYFSSQASYLNHINAPEAWDLHTGSNQVVVAVIDSGVDTGHPDLQGRLWINVQDGDGDGVDDDGNGCVDDRHGCRFVDVTPSSSQCGYTSSARTGDIRDDNQTSHGTAVAGVIGAAGNNGAGVSGIAWNVRIMPIKVLDCGAAAGGQPGGQMSNVAQGIDYARRMGADIINLSLANAPGTNGDISVLRAAIAAAEEDGVIIVAAAGNYGGLNVGYPAAYTQYSNVIGVGASQSSTGDTWYSASSYGPAIDFAAPGVQIASTSRSDTGAAFPYNGYTGTSFSTPLVSGMFALMLARNSRLQMDEYIQIARDAALPAQQAGHGGNWAGSGIANLGGAVAALPMTLEGSALHDWMDVPVGTPVRALINGVECGSTTTTSFALLARYAIRVQSQAEKNGCGQIGRSVVLEIDGRPAQPSIAWSIRNQDLALVSQDVSSVSPPPGMVVTQALGNGWSMVAQLTPGGDLPNAVSYLPQSWTQLAQWSPGANGGAGAYNTYAKNAPRFAQSLLELTRYDVFWVRGGPNTLSLPNPNAPARSVALPAGWNTFLYTGPHAQVQQALSAIDGRYTQVLRYDAVAAAWESYFPGQPRYFNDFGGLMELQVYSIYLTEAATLQMP